MPDPVQFTVKTQLICGRFYHVLIVNGRAEEAYLTSDFSIQDVLRLSVVPGPHGGLRYALRPEDL